MRCPARHPDQIRCYEPDSKQIREITLSTSSCRSSCWGRAFVGREPSAYGSTIIDWLLTIA